MRDAESASPLLPLVLLLLALSDLPAIVANEPYLVDDLDPGGHSDPQSVAAVGEHCFFRLRRPDGRYQLWVSDGRPGSSIALWMCPEGDRLAFRDLLFVSDYYGTRCGGLWVSDGTKEGTVRLRAPPASGFVGFDDRVYFGAQGDLWASDGSREGTFLVKEIGSIGFPTIAGRRMFFAANDGVHGREPWVSDGTAEGTYLLRDIRRGPESSGLSAANGATTLGTVFAASGDRVFFAAYDGIHGRELWTSDGTPEGTVLFDLEPGTAGLFPKWLTPFDGGVVFSSQRSRWDTQGTVEDTFWRSDGTAEGTFLVKRFSRNECKGCLRPWGQAGGRVVFVADDGVHGREPWASDGTAEGTTLLADIVEGPDSSTHQFGTGWRVGDRLLFFAHAGLYATDGRPEGTTLLRGFQDYPLGYFYREVAVAGERLFFWADDGIHGRELWSSDGTPEGTRLVADIFEGPGDGLDCWRYRYDPCAQFTVTSDRLFFAADDGVHGVELWALPLEVPSFRRGDANADGRIDMSDTLALVKHLFQGGLLLPCSDSADVDDSGTLEVTDAARLLAWMFLGGPAPPAPSVACGPDPTPEGLPCASFAPCEPRGEQRR